jgi:hypothetical protein
MTKSVPDGCIGSALIRVGVYTLIILLQLVIIRYINECMTVVAEVRDTVHEVQENILLPLFDKKKDPMPRR